MKRSEIDLRRRSGAGGVVGDELIAVGAPEGQGRDGRFRGVVFVVVGFVVVVLQMDLEPPQSPQSPLLGSDGRPRASARLGPDAGIVALHQDGCVAFAAARRYALLLLLLDERKRNGSSRPHDFRTPPKNFPPNQPAGRAGWRHDRKSP